MRPRSVFWRTSLALLLAASVSDEPHFPHALQAGFLAAAVVSAVIGLCQYFDLAAVRAPWVIGAHTGEAYANLLQPNQFSTLCWIGAAVIVFGKLIGSNSASLR